MRRARSVSLSALPPIRRFTSGSFSHSSNCASIRDFVIVEALELEFRSGFTVLTGETGAGKSILVDALELAVGDQGRHGGVGQPGTGHGFSPLGRNSSLRLVVSTSAEGPALQAGIDFFSGG